MSSTDDMNMLADRVMRAIETGDLDAIAACYEPEARIWHNFDEVAQTLGENLRTMEWIKGRLSNRKYEIIARHAFPGGYVQQHVLTGTLNSGKPFRMPACLVVQVRDGKITRLDEYLDAGQTKALALK
ncbi:MAG TPA: nuclear transport factor 2 family protein [Rhizomicrobium sp.]|jgi:ketosteroid isomerase-like protein